mgnify:CR=1 FL=1
MCPSDLRGIAHIDNEFAKRRMRQKKSTEQRVVFGLDCAALPHAFHARRFAAAGAMQGQPMAAGLDPRLNCSRLRGIRIRAGNVSDQQAAHREPFGDVAKIIGGGGWHFLFSQQCQQPKARMIVIVAGSHAGRKAAGDDVGAGKFGFCRF